LLFTGVCNSQVVYSQDPLHFFLDWRNGQIDYLSIECKLHCVRVCVCVGRAALLFKFPINYVVSHTLSEPIDWSMVPIGVCPEEAGFAGCVFQDAMEESSSDSSSSEESSEENPADQDQEMAEE
jgi:hypothetical protein